MNEISIYVLLCLVQTSKEIAGKRELAIENSIAISPLLLINQRDDKKLDFFLSANFEATLFCKTFLIEYFFLAKLKSCTNIKKPKPSLKMVRTFFLCFVKILLYDTIQ